MRRRAALAALAMVLFVNCGVESLPRSQPRGDVGKGTIHPADSAIGAFDNYFLSDYLDYATGSKVNIEIENAGDSRHEFTIPRLGVSTGTILPGRLVHVTIVVPKGSSEFVCRYHGGMRGEIVGREDEVSQYDETGEVPHYVP